MLVRPVLARLGGLQFRLEISLTKAGPDAGDLPLVSIVSSDPGRRSEEFRKPAPKVAIGRRNRRWARREPPEALTH
jgi:hypothetical protein